MPRALLLLPLLAACAEDPADALPPDGDGFARVNLSLALLGREICGNNLDDDGDRLVDEGCGGLFEDMMDGTNIHPGDRGTWTLYDGAVRFSYTGATSAAGGTLRLDRSVLNSRGQVISTVTTNVRMSPGIDLVGVTPALPWGRSTSAGTALQLQDSNGEAWLLPAGFGADDYSD